jgi:riboflavin biosynthesis pyrimidine reductase
MERDFTHYAKPVYKETSQPINREDFVASTTATSFAIAIDGQGKLGWNSGEMLGEQVITILTESVPDGYLANLRDVGVSYIFAGKDEVNLPFAMEKLRSLFNIETLMLEGGGHINGSFLNEGLIDEYHQLLLPLADGREETSSVMEIAEKDRRLNATLFKLKEVKQLENDILWLHYQVDERV